MSTRAWRCPIAGCNYQTGNPRCRAPHLLRVHQLLFQSHGRAPIPLPPEALAERLEALRRQQRGGRERRRDRETRAAADIGGTSSSQLHTEPVAGTSTTASFRAASVSGAGTDAAQPGSSSGPVAGVLTLDSDEEWAASVVDVLQFDQEDWDRELGAIPGTSFLEDETQDAPPCLELVPWVAPSLETEDPEIPGGLSPLQLVETVLSGEDGPEASLRDVFVVDEAERRLLLLFAEVALTAGRFVADVALSKQTAAWTLPA